MTWVNVVIPIVTLIIGIVIGFYGGVQYLKKQASKMNLGSMDDKQLRDMAKSMGMNLNTKQLNQLKKMQNKMKR